MKRIILISFALSLSFISCKIDKPEESGNEIAAIENGLITAIQIKGDSLNTHNIMDRMEHYKVPGVSIAVVRNGALSWAKGYGIANTNTGLEVNSTTIFQAGSISKPLAALAALKMVEEGSLDLDENVNEYLIDWKVPENKFTKEEKVTLRRLLTHTAGMTVHGFPGYKEIDSFPSITQVLNGKGNTPEIVVDTIPGSIWRYSGGGYTVMEKVVEDVSGLPLEDYMAKNILQPIGMTNSTFEQPLGPDYHANASAAYNSNGEIVDGLWHNYPEQAAAGLWTTPSDLAKYCLEVQEIFGGKENGFLSKETVELMMTKHKNNWGLGPSMRKENDSLLFGHGGKNEGFTNNLISFARQGNAVIVMTNADNGGPLIGEILNAVSNYYNWGISKPKVIETVKLSDEQLNRFTGKYKLNYQIDGIGDYFVEVSVEGNNLIVDDAIGDLKYILSSLSEMKFMDIDKGDEVVFDLESETHGFLWNNRFQFYKVE